MKKRRLLALALALITTTGILSGCGTSSGDVAGSAASSSSQSISSIEDGTVIIGRAYDVAGMDPGFLSENAQVVSNIYDTLVMRDSDEKTIPGLATEWKQVDDLTWEFKLREGVTFHNGEAFNADCVKYSIDRVLNPDNNSPCASYISTVESVEVMDDYTVRIHTFKADPLLATRFSRYPTQIVPPAYTEEVGQSGLAANPVGTGPYKFVSWTKDQEVVLEANADYWGGEPEVKKVIFRSIPETSTRVSALLNGEIDIAVSLDSSNMERLENADNAGLSTVEAAGNTVYIGLKCDTNPLNDVRVRQALNYAIDVDAIVSNVLGGTAVATDSLIGPADFGYSGDWNVYTYDPEKAKSLLAEAGYPNGFEMTMDTVNWYMNDTDVGQAIAGYLDAVGVKVTVNPVESSVYRTNVPNGEQNPMYMLGWSSTASLDADAAVYSILHSGESYSTYSNPEMDALLDEARSCMDETERADLYKQIEDLAIQDCPRIFLYKENKYYGVSKRINWQGRIDDAINVSSISFAN